MNILLCTLCQVWAVIPKALAILKQGFAHAFLPAEPKERLLKEMDGLIYELLVAAGPMGDDGAPGESTP